MMATKKQKSFNAELDDLLSGLDIPSAEEIREETRSAKISQSRTGIVFSENHRKNISKGGIGRVPPNKGKLTSEDVKEKQRKSHAGSTAPNKQPVMTPSGAFESAFAAGQWAQNNGIKNAYKKLQGFIYENIDPTQFRYITQEEFVRITDFPWKDPLHKPQWFSNKTRFRPVESPSGVFETLEDLIIWCKTQGLPNAKKKVAAWVKDGTIKYISKQEYYNAKNS
jgi:hypothetical protein